MLDQFLLFGKGAGSMVKFIYSEKATEFCKIFTLLMSVCTVDKSKVKISQNFVAFSEYTNFITFRLHTYVYYSINLKLVEHSFGKDDFLTGIFVSTTCLFICQLLLYPTVKSSLVLIFYQSMVMNNS